MNRAPLPAVPVTLLPLPRPLMTGEVLDAAFRLFRAGLLRTLPYSGLAVLVLELPALYSAVLGDTYVFAHRTTMAMGRGVAVENPVSPYAMPGLTDGMLVFVSALLLSVLLFGVITLRLSAVSRGERPSFRREIPTAIRRWPPALIATLAAFGFPMLIYGVASVVNPFLAIQLTFALTLPMLWPMALFIVSLPAFWCDGLAPFAAVARAARISRRRTWRIVGAILATGCMVAVFYVLTLIVAAMVGAVLAGADLVLMSIVRSLLVLVLGAFGVPFVLSVLIVAYEDLKLRDAERREARA
ncbi:MAG TPA: hypothetical protein VMF52_19130 [Steroidobacteraceae bacterium]|nr:hypothetical protein [Steroidobacteraceae bacterium]